MSFPRALTFLPWCGAAVLVAVVSCSDDPRVNFDDDDGGGGEGAGVGGDGGEGAQGGEGGALLAPPLRNPVDLDDDELAYQALIIMGHEPLGATTTTCSECHSINQGLMGFWRDLTDAAVADCFADTTVPSQSAAEAVLTCLRQKPSVPTSPFYTQKLGIYASAARLDWFAFVFDRANGGDGSAELADFTQLVGMPQVGQTPFTQGELDIVAEWFARGLPFMEDLLPDTPPPGGCEPNIEPAVGSHISAMAVSGWRAANIDAGLLMFGCAGASTPLECLDTYPLASSTGFGASWEHMAGATLRVLRTNNYSSSFWTRSSADGRFVGHGGSPTGGSTIVDLGTDQLINLDAAYDPGFFPDNSAFIIQGTNQGTGICTQDLLTSGTLSIDFDEPECNSSVSVGLYQHVGAALGGGDYWSVDSSFVSDNGGHFITLSNPSAYFDSASNVDLTPMIYTGSGFSEKPQISSPTPFEGDTIISKSSLLLMSRVAGAGSEQNGFSLRRMIATPSGPSYTVTTPEVGRYCINGGKPDISFDERWVVLHRYITDEDAVELGFTGPGDPGFAAYQSVGGANVYILDLLTGIVRRVTHMAPGQYALFPHFRSDGWIYFIVREQGLTHEYIVASDAALLLEG